jgi:hypothetical protein
MPLLDNKFFMLDCKIFCLGKLTRPHTYRFAQYNVAIHDKYRFTIPTLHMDMDGSVVVAVKEESESVFGKYCRHGEISGFASNFGIGKMEARIQW